MVDDSCWAKRGNGGAIRFGDDSQSIFATDTRLQHLVPNLQAAFKSPLIQPTNSVQHTQPAVLFFPEGSREPFPVVANGHFGQGRVVYFAARVDAALFSYGFPYQRVMLSRAVQWAARENYPIQVPAPMGEQARFGDKATSARSCICGTGSTRPLTLGNKMRKLHCAKSRFRSIASNCESKDVRTNKHVVCRRPNHHAA